MWGPWIKHDGGPCPCVGMYIQAEYVGIPTTSFVHGFYKDGVWEGVARGKTGWVWPCHEGRVVAYRIRKPKGMEILESILENLPNDVKETEDA